MNKKFTVTLVSVLSLAALAACKPKPPVESSSDPDPITEPTEQPSEEVGLPWEQITFENDSRLGDFVATLELPSEEVGARVLTEEELAGLLEVIGTNDMVINHAQMLAETNWYEQDGSATDLETALLLVEELHEVKRFDNFALEVTDTAEGAYYWNELAPVEVDGSEETSEEPEMEIIVVKQDIVEAPVHELWTPLELEDELFLANFRKGASSVLPDEVELLNYSDELLEETFLVGGYAYHLAEKQGWMGDLAYVTQNWYKDELEAGVMELLTGSEALLLADGRVVYKEGAVVTGEKVFIDGKYEGAYPGFAVGATVVISDGIVSGLEVYNGYQRYKHLPDPENEGEVLVPDPEGTYRDPWYYGNYFLSTIGQYPNGQLTSIPGFTTTYVWSVDELGEIDLADWNLEDFELVE